MSKHTQLSKREWLLLSAYLDGELSEKERRQVEEWLQSNTAGRKALEGLRRTHQVLRYTPQRSVPRNFTLTEDMLRKPLLPSFSRMFTYSSALAGLLLLVVLGLDLFTGIGKPQASALRAQAPAMETFKSAEDMTAVPQETPQIIYWGSSGPLLGAYGKGGGGGGDSGMAYGIGGGGGAAVPQIETAPLAEVVPQEPLGQQPEMLPEQQSGAVPEPQMEAPTEAMPEAESAPAPELQTAPSEENLAATPQIAQEEAAPQLDMGENATGTGETLPVGPILGIRPTDQQGRIQPVTRVEVAQPTASLAQISLRPVEGVLALLAVLLGLAAWFARRKFR